MIKGNFSFWLITGIGVGTALGVAFDNIPAGVSLGAGYGNAGIVVICFKKIVKEIKNRIMSRIYNFLKSVFIISCVAGCYNSICTGNKTIGC